MMVRRHQFQFIPKVFSGVQFLVKHEFMDSPLCTGESNRFVVLVPVKGNCNFTAERHLILLCASEFEVSEFGDCVGALLSSHLAFSPCSPQHS